MIKEKAMKYYSEDDYNCAEAVILGTRDALGLQFPEESFKLFSGFGGGMCAGKTCGAIAAAVAIRGYLSVGDKAHATEAFKETVAILTERLEEAFGSLNCDDIRPRMHTEEEGCLLTVEKVCEILDQFYEI